MHHTLGRAGKTRGARTERIVDRRRRVRQQGAQAQCAHPHAAAAQELAPSAERIGLLATDGCLQSGIYQAGLDAAGLTAELPREEELRELMALIKAIKGGKQTDDTARSMAALAEALVSRGAGAIIAGCTEIPMVLDESAVSVPLISSTDALAEITVKLATGEIRLPDCL